MLTEKLIEEMSELCLSENQTLWAQGDLLVKAALDTAELTKLAEKLQRKVSTLRDREMVAREVPAAKRDKRHAWTVYKTLMRVTEPEERWKLLESRSEWRVEDMEAQVALWLKKRANDRAGIELGDQTVRAGMRLGGPGGLKVKAERKGSYVEISIEGVLRDVDARQVGDKYRIVGYID